MELDDSRENHQSLELNSREFGIGLQQQQPQRQGPGAGGLFSFLKSQETEEINSPEEFDNTDEFESSELLSLERPSLEILSRERESLEFVSRENQSPELSLEIDLDDTDEIFDS